MVGVFLRVGKSKIDPGTLMNHFYDILGGKNIGTLK